MIIKSARFVQPHSRHSAIIEMRVAHDGVVGNSFVSCRVNTKTREISEVAGVKDGPKGDALIAYLRVAAASATGKLPRAIDRAFGW